MALLHRLSVIGVVSLVISLGAGCVSGGPEIAYVEGRITLDGEPLVGATIVFVPKNGRPSGAATGADGKYVLNFANGRKGAVPGTNTVRIMTLRDADQDENGKSIPGRPETVPAEYNSETTLSFEVEPKKKNIANFELHSSKSGKSHHS